MSNISKVKFLLDPLPFGVGQLFRLMFEEILDVVFGKQGTSEDTQDFIDISAQAKVMLDDSCQTVRRDGRIDLYADSILCVTPKRLDAEVLLYEFEEQFYLPAIFVKKGYILCREVEIVGVERKRPVEFLGIIDDAPYGGRIVFYNTPEISDTRIC